MRSDVVRMSAAAALAALLLMPASAAQSSGSVTGTVTLSAARSAPLATSVYGRRGVAPKPSAAGSETRNVVIYLADVKPPNRPPPMRAAIVQRGERFVPPVTAITAGSTVDFPNEDPFFHNVFSLSRAGSFDLGRYRSGESRSRQFTAPGRIKVFCDIHSQMSALILVLDHPWFTIPQETGAFTLSGLPPGDHTLVAWHERIGERRDRVRVTPGGTTHISFTLPVLEAQP
jgi:plastocyanin